MGKEEQTGVSSKFPGTLFLPIDSQMRWNIFKKTCFLPANDDLYTGAISFSLKHVS